MKTGFILAGLAVVGIVCVALVFGDRLVGDRPLINGAKEAAAGQLRDPSSAQFRNIRVNGTFVCGEINGKNAYGAYSGFVRFYGMKYAATIDPQDQTPVMRNGPSPSDIFNQSFATYCS